MHNCRKKELFLISVIFGIALILRLAFFLDYKNTATFPVLPESDSDFYYQRAADITSGDIFNSKAFLKWPFYAYLLAFLFKISANNVFLVFALQFLLGAATCALSYFIGRELFDKTTGFIAGLLCAWYGLFIFYEGLIIYTSLSLFLNALFFLLILKIRNNISAKNLFWLGIFLGICTITQGNIIIFGLLAVFWILWQKRRGIIKYFFSFCLGLGLVLAALVLRSYIVDKNPALLTGNTGLNFYIGNSAEANGTLVWPMNLTPTAGAMLRDAAAIAKLNLGRELGPSGISRFWFEKAIDFIKKNPSAYFRLLFRKTGYLFSPKEFIFEPEYTFVSDKIRVFKIMFMDLGLILPFVFLGMLLNFKNINRAWLLYLALLTLGFSIILFFVQAKFRIMLTFFFMIFAASAVSEFWKLAKNKSFLRFGFMLLILSAFFILLKQPPGSTNQIEKAQADFVKFRYHFARAVAFEEKSDYPLALSELNLADKIKPDNHNIAYSFGVMYYNMNKFDKSEEYFKRAIAISPFFVDAYYNLGFLYNRQKRLDEALVILKKAAFLDPDDIGVLFELARACRAKGMLKEARQELNLVLKKLKYRPLEKAAVERELADLEK